MIATVQGIIDHLTLCVESDPSIGELPVYLSKDREGNDFRPTEGDFDIVGAWDLGIETTVGDNRRVAVLWPAW